MLDEHIKLQKRHKNFWSAALTSKKAKKVTKMDHFWEAPNRQKKSASAANNIFSPILAVISQKASDSATIRRDSAELGRRIGGGVVQVAQLTRRAS